MANPFFQLLRKDHKEVKGILEQLKDAKEGPGKKREELFRKLMEELVPHMKAEEKTFYSSLVRNEEAREHGLEGIEEHHVAELVLKELEKMPKGEDQWSAKFSVFKEILEHHIQEEEGAIFKTAESALKPDEIQNIMSEFEQEKQKIRKDKFKSAA